MGDVVTLEDLAVALIVALAVAYLVWKLGLSGRVAKRRKPVDVSVHRLVRKSSHKRNGGCH